MNWEHACGKSSRLSPCIWLAVPHCCTHWKPCTMQHRRWPLTTHAPTPPPLTCGAGRVGDGELAAVGLGLQVLVVAQVLHALLGDDAQVHVGAAAQVVVDAAVGGGGVPGGDNREEKESEWVHGWVDG
jgi:hypothetical protein